MIDFIVKLEDMLRQSGYADEDWEIRYFPNEKHMFSSLMAILFS